MYYSLQYLLSVLNIYLHSACIMPRVPQSLDEGITRKNGIIGSTKETEVELRVGHSVGCLTSIEDARQRHALFAVS